MVSVLQNLVTRDVMLGLAGETYFERGEDYHRGGHVHDLVEHEGVVVAKVAGTEDYRVRLWAEDGRRLGREAEFDEYVKLLRLEYRRKRNFMKLLDGME